jgi:hypothetical protein
MSYSNRREIGDALSEEKTRSYEVGSYYSGPGPRIIVQTFPTGSFATTQWAEKRHAIKTTAVKEVLAETPASA